MSVGSPFHVVQQPAFAIAENEPAVKFGFVFGAGPGIEQDSPRGIEVGTAAKRVMKIERFPLVVPLYAVGTRVLNRDAPAKAYTDPICLVTPLGEIVWI